MIRIALTTGTLHLSPGYVITTMPDGSTVHGVPHDTREYAAHAAARGYSSVEAANAGHEVGHSLLAAWLGLPCSPTFLRLAHGDMEATGLTNIEEAAVMAIETYASAMGVCLVKLARRAGT